MTRLTKEEIKKKVLNFLYKRCVVEIIILIGIFIFAYTSFSLIKIYEEKRKARELKRKVEEENTFFNNYSLFDLKKRNYLELRILVKNGNCVLYLEGCNKEFIYSEPHQQRDTIKSITKGLNLFFLNGFKIERSKIDLSTDVEKHYYLLKNCN